MVSVAFPHVCMPSGGSSCLPFSSFLFSQFLASFFSFSFFPLPSSLTSSSFCRLLPPLLAPRTALWVLLSVGCAPFRSLSFSRHAFFSIVSSPVITTFKLTSCLRVSFRPCFLCLSVDSFAFSGFFLSRLHSFSLLPFLPSQLELSPVTFQSWGHHYFSVISVTCWVSLHLQERGREGAGKGRLTQPLGTTPRHHLLKPSCMILLFSPTFFKFCYTCNKRQAVPFRDLSPPRGGAQHNDTFSTFCYLYSQRVGDRLTTLESCFVDEISASMQDR